MEEKFRGVRKNRSRPTRKSRFGSLYKIWLVFKAKKKNQIKDEEEEEEEDDDFYF